MNDEEDSSMPMRYLLYKSLSKAFAILLLGILVPFALAQNASNSKHNSAQPGNLQIPVRPADSLFQGGQGNQKTEIRFDPGSGMVTLKLLVQDPNGFFIPNIRRDNFMVFENDVRQSNATVEIEHSPVSLSLLVEYGGRQKAMNRELGSAVKRASQQILEQLERQDSISMFKYGNSVEPLGESSQGYDSVERAVNSLEAVPEFSETNFYDALAFTLTHMQGKSGRKAIFVISSGIDTFSKTSYESLQSLAGLHEFYLGVTGFTPVLDAVRLRSGRVSSLPH
jgi:hypothetical protein